MSRFHNLIFKMILLGFAVCPSVMFAYTMEHINTSAKNDFVLEPGKAEVTLLPGETKTEYIHITSRVPGVARFSLVTEDMKGSDYRDQPVVLLGNERGPYSLKDYLKPEIESFELSLGDRITIAVEISIPLDAEPGGLYGSVVIVSEPYNVSGAQARIVSRLGSLFLIRVEGEAKEEGTLEDFRLKEEKLFYEKGPFVFEVMYRNTGNVHSTPYGLISVDNILGNTIDEIPIDAYFVLPGSLRYRELEWSKNALFGRYTATVEMYAGRNADKYTDEISFWVLPWKLVLVILTAVFIVIYLFYFLGTRFEFKRKD